jgi:hypothetical protein
VIRTTLIFFFLVVLQFEAFGQQPYLHEVDVDLTQIVLDIEQDSTGVLWMLHDKGLLRYDGYEITPFDSPIDSAAKLSCAALFGSKIYIGSSAGVLFEFDLHTRSYTPRLSLEDHEAITSIAIHPTGDLLVSQNAVGLIRLPRTSSTGHLLESSPKFVYDMLWINADSCVIATDTGLVLWEKEANTFNEIGDLEYNITTHLALSPSGELWASDYNKGVMKVDFNSSQQIYYPLFEAQRILDLTVSTNDVIISTKAGLLALSPNGEWIRWEGAQISIRNAGALFIDDEYNLWASTKHDGLFKGSLYFKAIDLDLPAEVQAMAWWENKLWLGTSNGLYLWKRGSAACELTLANANITCFYPRTSVLLVGTLGHGLIAVDVDGKNIASIPNQYGADDSVLSLFETEKNKILISTLSGILELHEKGSLGQWSLKKSSFTEALKKNYVLSMIERNGETWFANDKAGISRYKDGALTNFSILNGNKIGSAYSMNVASDQRLWLSSEQEGLLYIDGDSLTKWQSPHFYQPTYYSVVTDYPGKLLLIGETSVDLYDSERHEMVSFSNEIGLGSEECFLNNFASENGRLWFMHNKRLWYFNLPPSGARTKAVTVIDELEVNLDPVSLDRNNFSHFENNFKFRVSGVLHKNTERLFYFYKLEGFDDDWRVTQDREISYPHLPAGEYSFVIHSSHDELSPPVADIVYSFEIQGPFYFAWWSIALLLAVFITLFLIVDRRRRKNLWMAAELKRLKTETQLINLKSQLNPHFLFNSFNTMIGLVEEDPARGIQFMEHLTEFYRGVLEIGEKEKIALSQEVELLKSYVHLLQERFGEAIDIVIEEHNSSGLIPPLTLQMLVENAVKHNVVSIHSPLHISIGRRDNYIIVKNNLNLKQGTSIASFGIGLSNIKSRYALLEADQVIIEQTDEFFEVKVPVIGP